MYENVMMLENKLLLYIINLGCLHIICVSSLSNELADPVCSCHYVPVLGLYWSDAGSIGPVQARYWQ